MNMKLFPVLVLLMLAEATNPEVFAQSQSQNTFLSGQVKDYQGDYMLLRFRDRLDTIQVDTSGYFNFSFEQSFPSECRILAGKSQQRLFLHPGDKLNLNFNPAQAQAFPEFTGSNAAYSNFYADYIKFDMPNARHTSPKTSMGKSPAVIAHKVDSVTTVRVNFIKNYCEKNSLSQQFSAYQQIAARYIGASELAAYKRMSPQFRPDSIPDQTKKLEQVMMSVPANNHELTYNEHFQSFVRQLAAGNALKSIKLTNETQLPEFYMLQFDETLALISDEECKNYILKELVVEAIKETGTRNIQPLIDRFNSECTNEPMKMRVEKVWLPYSKIQIGMECPNIEGYTTEGNNVTIADLRGKVVYIDVWATWCGPCKKEIPMLKTLESFYHGKDVEFVSVSTDQDVQKWKDFVAKEALGGLQLHQSDNIDLTVSKNFMVNSIPRFILLDKNGKIISADAPRPSSDAVIKAMIDALL